MRALKLIIIITALLVVSSMANAAHPEVLESYNHTKVASGDKGVVFLNLTEGRKGGPDEPLTFVIKKLGDTTGKSYSAGQDRAFLSSHHQKAAKATFLANAPIMLDPGFYYIEQISLVPFIANDFMISYWFPAPGIQKNVVVYGMFEVKGGEVVSLGEYYIPRPRNYRLIRQNDNFKALQKQLGQKGGKKFALLAKKLKKGKMYLPGASYSKDGSGKIVISDRNSKSKVSNVTASSEIDNI